MVPLFGRKLLPGSPKNKEHDSIFGECIKVKSWSKHLIQELYLAFWVTGQNNIFDQEVLGQPKF